MSLFLSAEFVPRPNCLRERSLICDTRQCGSPLWLMTQKKHRLSVVVSFLFCSQHTPPKIIELYVELYTPCQWHIYFWAAGGLKPPTPPPSPRLMLSTFIAQWAQRSSRSSPTSTGFHFLMLWHNSPICLRIGRQGEGSALLVSCTLPSKTPFFLRTSRR